MSTDHDDDRDDDRDDAPALPDRDVLDAWRVPPPAVDLTDRVLAHVEAGLPLATVTTLPVAPRRGLGLAVVGVAMVAAAALVLGLTHSWNHPPAAEPAPAAVAAPPLDAEPAAVVPEDEALALRSPTSDPAPGPDAPLATERTEAEVIVHDLDDPFARASTPSRIGPSGLMNPFDGSSEGSHAVPSKASDGGGGSSDLKNPFDRPTRASAGRSPPELDGVLIDPPSDDDAPDDADKTATLRIGVAKGLHWATVYINGVRIGPTPIMSVKVAPGRHTVRWEWADGTSATARVELAAGDVKSLKSPLPSGPTSTP